MNTDERTKLSKAMSLLLRHRPERGHLTLDEQGWVSLDSLVEGLSAVGIQSTRGHVLEVIAECSKQRFSWDKLRDQVRANQGHSVEVDLNLSPQEPPMILYHGTVSRFLESIRVGGLHKRKRHHVHLSEDLPTAKNVGKRRGHAIILQVDAMHMVKDGYAFFRSHNGVWLTDHVPPAYLRFPTR